MINFLYRIFKLFISVKLAVFVILILGFLSAIGTIYEAKFDSEYAQKIIYHGPWMYFFMGLLVTQLICVMVDRWPWKKRHIPFLLAHVGIIITLAGSLITRYWGVDGSMSFGIGEKSRQVTVGEKEIMVLGSFDGQKYSQMAAKTVDFLLRPPNQNPTVLQFGKDTIEVRDYYHYAFRKEELEPSVNKLDGPAIRFQIENDRVNLTRWISLGRGQAMDEANLGPAKIILMEGQGDKDVGQGNLILFQIDPQTKKGRYEVRSKDGKRKTLKGELTEGMSLDTGWMNLKLRILRFLPHAEQKISFEKRESPTPLTTSAVKISFNGVDHWVGLNNSLRLFTDQNVFVFVYGNRRLDLGFSLTLRDFRVGRYQGTAQAMSYESDVTLDDGAKTTISMNNPLKHKGYTFYQASFQEDDQGNPVASILSVNQDPGRFWKYLGSAMVIIGAVMLFTVTAAFRANHRKREGAVS
ncbi:MAG: cytochrome c biogenesis protein ResB [Bdellovibrionales bacterium]|nr:cytochrome c biogenesis protein ResB [Bdellovibrionales bacterium]